MVGTEMKPANKKIPKIYKYYQSIKAWCKTHKRLSISLGVTFVLLFIATIICSIQDIRYAVFSPFLKRDVEIYVFDATTKSPIHNAAVKINNSTKHTSTDGKVHFSDIPVGIHGININLPLYTSENFLATVPILSKAKINASLKANGKRISITIRDKINGKPIDGVIVTANKSSGISKSDGKIELVVPINTSKIEVSTKKDGYIATSLTLSTDSSTNIGLIKTGRVYFLSKQSGVIDVVSTNLDGSDRQTIVKGTGNEYDYDTSLLASRNWRYLALNARRDDNKNALYIIDTSNPGQLSRITDGGMILTPVGWSGERFIYNETNIFGYAANWSLRSVSGENKKVTVLEKVDSAPFQQFSYTSYQSIGTPYILSDDTIVYPTTWSGGNYLEPRADNKSAGIIAIQADGSNRHFIKEYHSNEISTIETNLYKPQEIHYRVFNANGEKRENIMTVNKKIEVVPPDQQKFDQSYPTFLISPDGNHSLWSEERDGKNTLFIGDNNSGGPQEIASLSDYIPYGWFTDDYILLQKNNSELYISSTETLKSGIQPLKISDYHKGASLIGYGYGYGGQ